MIRQISLLAHLALFYVTAYSQTRVTLEDLWINYRYYPNSVGAFHPLKDGEHFVEAKDRRLEKFQFKTGKSLGYITPQLPFDIEDYEFDDREETLLLTTDSRPIYRHSRQVKAYVLAQGVQSPKALASENPVQEPDLNPTGTLCAYVKGNNIFIEDVKSAEIKQITRDGKENEILNGIPDWVYEEEFSMSKAFAWNKSGNMLAYLRFDETHVPSFSMPIYGGQLYPQLQTFKYPKVGESNSQVTLNVYHLTLKKTQGIVIPDGYEYLPRFQWLDDGRLMLATLNRLQNHLRLYVADPTTGKTTLIAEMRSARYIELEKVWQPVFLSADECLLLSEESGYFHMYAYSLRDKKPPRPITQGNWEVTKIYGYDAQSGFIYFQSTEASPLDRHIYRIRKDGKGLERLTREAGTHDAEFAATFRYFMRNYSALGTPPVYSCHDASGRLLYIREDNASLKEKLEQLEGTKPEFFTLTTSEDIVLNGWMLKPPGFSPEKKYPVFMYVYGGPGSQTANNDYDGFNYIWFRMLAQNGYIVVSVDGRGTGGRGYEFRTCTYGRLGDLESTDQAEAARWLGRQPYVDPARIGIFGWSYGGYLAALCITRWADVFKAAIAVAPVTNWKYYDNIYTERYMGTIETNPDGFDQQSPIRYAKNLKGAFLLIHGSADDNVHLQNSMELAAALVAAGKPFDMFIYPDKNHGIYGGLTRYHLYQKMTRFIFDNL
jgi:dipeptidyl-peptidase-4